MTKVCRQTLDARRMGAAGPPFPSYSSSGKAAGKRRISVARCTDHSVLRVLVTGQLSGSLAGADESSTAGFRKGMSQRAVWGQRKATMNWDLRHRKSSLVIRLLLAVWIVVVVVVLCATGRWWGMVFVIPLILDVYLLRRILAASSGW